MAVVSTGFFDGVHLGHRHVIDRLLSEAKAAGEESVVVTFWPHPRNVLQDDARNLRLLTSLQEKQLLLNGLGVDRIEVIPFTREFSRMTTETYLREVLIGRFGAGTVILGYDNRIGSDLLSSEDIVPIAERLGLRAIVECPVTVSPEGVTVSSTKIREALAEGRVGDAGAMLGYRYCLHGVVVAGNKLGRTIGFPTANMQLYDPLKMIPSNGVYAVEVETVGRHLYGMCNIGVRPTVGQGNARTIETNIFDFDEDIYGLDIRVRFIDKIRDEHQFDSLQSLASQLFLDREACLGKIPAPSL
ncbi:MAG: riboflavin biosynthesis protein RibF [Bacteroidales bacterium]|nr:riboflavin biosynthesis protein RibF [Bacteroidales bacterium]